MSRTLQTIALAALVSLALSGCSRDQPAPELPPAGAETGAAPAPGEPVGDPIPPSLQAQPLPRRGGAEDLAEAREAVKRSPEGRAVLFHLIQQTQAAGSNLAGTDRQASIPLFLESAAAARALRDSHPDLSPIEAQAIAVVFYNEACSLAIQDGKADSAMTVLKEAVAAGFRNEVLKTDPELNSLRDRPDFRELLADPDAADVPEPEALLDAGKPFPFALDLPGLDGKPVTLADLKGKVVMVDFWGTWCPPCREEVPDLITLHDTYHDRGLEILGVNCYEGDGPEAEQKVRAFLKDRAIPYRCALANEEVEAQVPDFEGFPTTVFLDRSGKVRLTLGPEADRAALAKVAGALIDEK